MKRKKLLIAFSGIVAIIALGLLARSNFLRAKEVAKRNACIANLRQVHGYKVQWGTEYKKAPSALPTDADLKSMPIAGLYYGLLRCPAEGVYTLGRLDQKPTCSIPGHILPDEALHTQ